MRDALKRVPPLYWVARRARLAVGDLLPARGVPGVPGPVHGNDVMFVGSSPEEYAATGRSAAEFVAAAVTAADIVPAAGLDLGCGHGRVLRHLVDLVPAAWTACDLDASGVRFCSRAFAATPVRSRIPLSAVTFPATYDVVWMGSLVTHLGEAALDDLWATLGACTAPTAIVAMSVLRPAMAVHLEMFGPGMQQHLGDVERRLEAAGVAYVPYPHYARGDYGVTFHDPDRLPAQVAAAGGRTVELMAHEVGAWQGMQDYVALRFS
ncbi:MAG: class I SAM-dependent methyltransferase [Acidimicrobiales bacterium]|nr:class I SAM-dependent methyltransferase [Acidimicrobiales bacterium]